MMGTFKKYYMKNNFLSGDSFGSEAEKMEKEKQDAMEVGKEKKEKAQKKDEKKGRGAIIKHF